MRGTLLFVQFLILPALMGCGMGFGQRATLPESHFGLWSERADSLVAAFRRETQPELLQRVGSNQATVLTALAGSQRAQAGCKLGIVLRALAEPWGGMEELEGRGRHVLDLAKDPQIQLSALIGALAAGTGRTQGEIVSPPPPVGEAIEDHLDFITAGLMHSYTFRQRALRMLSPDERKFLFDHAGSLVQQFYPHFSDLDSVHLQQAKNDLRFCRLVADRLDYAALLASAQVLARFADDRWQQSLVNAFQAYEAPLGSFSLVQGKVLAVRPTPFGLIIVGGPGPNAYELHERIAVVIDVGGDDTYRGHIAAASDVERGNRVVIDLSGRDSYFGSSLGLATGRLGVGLLIDREGDDQYHIGDGSAGAGFAGIGVLVDSNGDDEYIGAKLTQGVAIGGVGLLLDEGGRDQYTSFGYGLGFGGPLGVGAVVDVAGNDHYQCGAKYPSSYNEVAARRVPPGDPRFEYDGFCMGVGSGKRVLTEDPQGRAYSLAGGWGMILDLQGNDRYRSANFSQGSGYFFGAGLKLDLAGNDRHAAARYGQAAGAHYGVGLFIDAGGEDQYFSTGPVYNGATAWDLSVMLFIDAGAESDMYDLSQSDGLGRADRNGWSVFLEEAGDDSYFVPRGFGLVSDFGMSAFFDLGGDDEYFSALSGGQVGNGLVSLRKPGGLFVDRDR